jgi:hypothetical protein
MSGPKSDAMAYLIISLFLADKDVLLNLRLSICHPVCFQRIPLRSLRAIRNKILDVVERKGGSVQNLVYDNISASVISDKGSEYF